MNNKFIILWGVIIFGLVLSIYIIGVNKINSKEYDDLKDAIRLAVDNYLSDNDLWPVNTITVNTSELINYNYLNELYYEGSKCSAVVTVTNTGNKYKYEYDITCVYE